MFFEPNTIIRDYRIIRLLGQGGMGEVYLAEDVMLGKKIALKVLNLELSKNQNLINRFILEAKVQATLLHPNIVTLHSLFKDNGIFIMVMEFAEGLTIKEVILKNGPFDEKRAVKICLDILTGLSFAHSKGIIHRDIKSTNIMLSSDEKIKIMDFGIAKVMGVKGLTETGGKLGTILFMSPEQIMADPSINQQTDIYSLGITLYEMLTGNLPFSNTESQFKLMKEIVELKLKDPRTFCKSISPELVGIIYKMTAKERKERFQSCEETTEVLKRFLKMDNITKSANQNIKEVTTQSQNKSFVNNIQNKLPATILETTQNNVTNISKLNRANEKTFIEPIVKSSSKKKVIIVLSVLIAAVSVLLAYQFIKSDDKIIPIKTQVKEINSKIIKGDTSKSENKLPVEPKEIVKTTIQKNKERRVTNTLVKKKDVNKVKDIMSYKKQKQEGLNKPLANRPAKK